MADSMGGSAGNRGSAGSPAGGSANPAGGSPGSPGSPGSGGSGGSGGSAHNVPGPSASDLLRAADALLSSALPGTRGMWQRTAAFLIRMALEQSLDEFWARVRPEIAACSMRAQLLCLAAYADGATAERVAAAWAGLSRACHYHTYELAPAGAELRRWREEVAMAGRALGHVGSAPP